VAVAGNDLIAQLPRRDRLRLLAISESVQLEHGVVLCQPSEPSQYVYFPNDCCISLLMATDGPSWLGVGMVGREGMLGAQLVLGVHATPMYALVQEGGTAWRIEAAPFCRELVLGEALRRHLNLYLYVQMAHLATSAACIHTHLIGPRLSRWLLMTQDRMHSEASHLTQEFLARMLGVRRVGITGAAADLQRRGLIRYRRGEIEVLDRAGLEGDACGCYAADRAAHARFVRSSGPNLTIPALVDTSHST